MYSIEQNGSTIDIYLTRGDYFACLIGMTKGDEEYVPLDGTLRFAAKKSYRDSDDKCKINVNIPLDTRLLELESEHTKSLPFGKYVYDIEYTDANGRPDTFIKGKLILTEEVI